MKISRAKLLRSMWLFVPTLVKAPRRYQVFPTRTVNTILGKAGVTPPGLGHRKDKNVKGYTVLNPRDDTGMHEEKRRESS